MMQGIFNSIVTIKRRQSVSVASRDILNTPTYGTPTTNWSTIYTNMPARLAFSSKQIQFAQTGERITPNGIAYIPPQYQLYHEDRLITSDGIEYIVTGVSIGYINNTVVDHYELTLELP
jgi:hypothetical protein